MKVELKTIGSSSGSSTNIPVAGSRGRLEGPDDSGLEVGRRACRCGGRELVCGVVHVELGGKGGVAEVPDGATAGIGARLGAGDVWVAVACLERGARISTSILAGEIDELGAVTFSCVSDAIGGTGP